MTIADADFVILVTAVKLQLSFFFTIFICLFVRDILVAYRCVAENDTSQSWT